MSPVFGADKNLYGANKVDNYLYMTAYTFSSGTFATERSGRRRAITSPRARLARAILLCRIIYPTIAGKIYRSRKIDRALSERLGWVVRTVLPGPRRAVAPIAVPYFSDSSAKTMDNAPSNSFAEIYRVTVLIDL